MWKKTSDKAQPIQRREADETFYKLLIILGVKFRRMSTELYSPGLKLIELSAFVSQVLGLKMDAIMPGSIQLF